MGTDKESDADAAAAAWNVPSWAGKPPPGVHLDVLKGDKLVQKLMVDEKRCYYFGRNPQQCDVAIDHASCSRVHAALVYHRHLRRFFLVDLGSSHGTYVGKLRLDALASQHLPAELSFHFGASTRRYVLKERLQRAGEQGGGGDGQQAGTGSGGEHLPQKEDELASLTEYNTALNGRLGAMPIPDEPGRPRRRANARVVFADGDDIINPEDVDPSVGRFRNLISTAVISKRPRMDEAYNELMSGLGLKGVRPPASVGVGGGGQQHSILHQSAAAGGPPHVLPGGIAPADRRASMEHVSGFGPISTKLGLSMPNLAPDVDLSDAAAAAAHHAPAASAISPVSPAVDDERHEHYADDGVECPRKKKYAKEAWPGKKPGAHHHGGLLLA